MKAFDLFSKIIANGIDNNCMDTYEHNDIEGLHDYFGKEYQTFGISIPKGTKMLAIWSDMDGKSRILTICDYVLINENDINDRIYLYKIE
jgi:hypothetical protein